MKYPVDAIRPVRMAGLSTGLAAAALLAACGHAAAEAPLARALPADRTGPAADYPMLLGQPFTVDGVTYSPADVMNYDQVGYASAGTEGAGVSLAHRTLPLPSYVEVTSLRTGKTILVRVERRGPMSGRNLVELSPAAAAQLGLDGAQGPVRVRRVNPMEPERALLRAGQAAPARMDTPMSLVGVLMRKLEPGSTAASPSAIAAAPAALPATPSPASASSRTPRTALAPGGKARTIAASPSPAPALPTAQGTSLLPAAPRPKAPAPGTKASALAVAQPAAAPRAAPAAKAPVRGNFVVQIAAFADPARAEAAARKLGGGVSPAGKLHRVRINGFATATDAGTALAKARAAGYTDARIQRAD